MERQTTRRVVARLTSLRSLSRWPHSKWWWTIPSVRIQISIWPPTNPIHHIRLTKIIGISPAILTQYSWCRNLWPISTLLTIAVMSTASRMNIHWCRRPCQTSQVTRIQNTLHLQLDASSMARKNSRVPRIRLWFKWLSRIIFWWCKLYSQRVRKWIRKLT